VTTNTATGDVTATTRIPSTVDGFSTSELAARSTVATTQPAIENVAADQMSKVSTIKNLTVKTCSTVYGAMGSLGGIAKSTPGYVASFWPRKNNTSN
jgi:hypothetical protein